MKKKNILYVDEGLAFGGSFIVAARLASHLDEELYNTVIITSAPLCDIAHHATSRVKLIHSRKWLTYKHRGTFIGRLKTLSGRSLAHRILRKLAIYAYSSIEYFANSPYLLHLCYQVIRYKIDIIHGNNAIEAITAARILRRKIVWHIHGDGLYSSGQINRHLKHAHKFISVSQYSAANAIRAGIPAEKLVIIHNPIGPTLPTISQGLRISMKQHYEIPQDIPVIGIFGRLINWKGQLEFLKAAKGLIENGYPAHFLIVGDDGENFGSYTKTLQDFVKTNSLDGNVTFSGYVKNTNEHYQLCDIIIHASIAPEPFGLVIIEAMQNGIAVIGANSGAAPELISHKKTGLIANPKDTNELIEAIIYLIENGEIRHSYAKSGCAFVHANMHPMHYAQQVARVYSEC